MCKCILEEIKRFLWNKCMKKVALIPDAAGDLVQQESS